VRKVIVMTKRPQSALAAAIALSLGLSLAACDTESNKSLDSINQPVVERQNFTLDLNAGGDRLSVPEQRRLADWFDTMDLRYGDRVGIDGPLAGGGVRNDVAAIASRHGILLSEGAPVTEGFVEPGMVRVVVTRSRAYVPNCPDWSDQMNSNLGNATSDNYGCAVNSNIAAMVANPEHLLHGAQATGETVVMSSTKAIQTYRAQEPTGKAGLPKISAQSAGGN
jgi:pilus assembly protein CpaD